MLICFAYTLSWGQKYEGETNSEGKPHGKGKLIFNTGDIQEGHFINGQIIKGKVFFHNGRI